MIGLKQSSTSGKRKNDREGSQGSQHGATVTHVQQDQELDRIHENIARLLLSTGKWHARRTKRDISKPFVKRHTHIHTHPCARRSRNCITSWRSEDVPELRIAMPIVERHLRPLRMTSDGVLPPRSSEPNHPRSNSISTRQFHARAKGRTRCTDVHAN